MKTPLSKRVLLAIWISPDRRARIHEPLSFRAPVKTDAGTAAAAHTEGSKVRIARNPGPIPRSSRVGVKTSRSPPSVLMKRESGQAQPSQGLPLRPQFTDTQ